jgi:enoyl-CoA hydratase/carnithine racemase
LIAAIEGYATCLAFQLSCLCDLRVAEMDSVFGMHSAAVPLHPKVQTVLDHYKLPELMRRALHPQRTHLSIEQAHQQSFVTEATRVGCAVGRAIELAKSLTKFSQPALLSDRADIWKVVLAHHDHSSLRADRISDEVLLKEMRYGADRFVTHGIGRHGSSKLHTLEEIYEAIQPKVFDESQLKGES